MTQDRSDAKNDLGSMLIEFGKGNADAPTSELLDALREAVRRRVGDLLMMKGAGAPIDAAKLADELSHRLGAGLPTHRFSILQEAITAISEEVLLEKGPREVTRLVWAWEAQKISDQAADAQESKEIEEQLFRAIEIELRHQIYGILNQSIFTGLRHKIEYEEVVSELYLKLKKAGISVLPANRRQFHGLIEVALNRILADLGKRARAKGRPQSQFKQPILDNHIDQRTGQDQLKTLLDEEEMLKLENNILKLEPQEQEIFRLRRQGVPVKEVAEMLNISESTVKRDMANAKAFLSQVQRADADLNG